MFIGRYRAFLKNFTGTIYFDPNNIEKSRVSLKIDIGSIESEHPTFDNFARSGRLLDVENYPKVVFQGHLSEKTEKGYKIDGTLSLHGVTKGISFPITLEGPYTDYNKTVLAAHGKFMIRRKDFKVVWSKLFDYGGVIVGNHVVVEWNIVSIRQ